MSDSWGCPGILSALSVPWPPGPSFPEMLLPGLGMVVTLTWQQHRGLRRLSEHLVKDYNSMITKTDSIPHSGRDGVAGATKVPLFERKIQQTQMWSCLYKPDIRSTTVKLCDPTADVLGLCPLTSRCWRLGTPQSTAG